MPHQKETDGPYWNQQAYQDALKIFKQIPEDEVSSDLDWLLNQQWGSSLDPDVRKAIALQVVSPPDESDID